MGALADKLRSRLEPTSPLPGLVADIRRLADQVEEMERVNDDLEDQIFEDGGFIIRIVDLEAENAHLRGMLDDV